MKSWLVIILLLPFSILAQEFEFKANTPKNEIFVGEPTLVDLTLKIPANYSVDTVYFEFSKNRDSTDNNWELWETSSIDKKTLDGNDNNYFVEYSQQYTIATFDSGYYEFPPIIAFVDTAMYQSNLLQFSVKLQPTNEKNVKDIKPIKEVNIEWWEYVIYYLTKAWEKILYFVSKYWGWIILSILLLAGIVTLIVYLLKRRNKGDNSEEKKPTIPLEIQLLETLEKIKTEKHWENGHYKVYYSKLSEVLWRFLEHGYEIKTFEKTSKEILESLKWTSIPEKYFSELKRFFEISDSVKFAKINPVEKDNTHSLNLIIELIIEERTDIVQTETELTEEKKD